MTTFVLSLTKLSEEQLLYELPTTQTADNALSCTYCVMFVADSFFKMGSLTSQEILLKAIPWNNCKWPYVLKTILLCSLCVPMWHWSNKCGVYNILFSGILVSDITNHLPIFVHVYYKTLRRNDRLSTQFHTNYSPNNIENFVSRIFSGITCINPRKQIFLSIISVVCFVASIVTIFLWYVSNTRGRKTSLDYLRDVGIKPNFVSSFWDQRQRRWENLPPISKEAKLYTAYCKKKTLSWCFL